MNTYGIKFSPTKTAHYVVEKRTDLAAKTSGANVIPELCNQIIVFRDFKTSQQIHKDLKSKHNLVILYNLLVLSNLLRIFP